MNVLKCHDLFFSYSGIPVLENVNFSIEEGEFIGIIGPNGGGKTTLLKLIMGFLKPTRGKLLLFGKAPISQKIGWVPQGFDFDKKFPITVLEVVLGGCLGRSSWYGGFSIDDRRYALESLEAVGLLDSAKLPFAGLSGGQAQRVLIARALASKPSLLLLDEPTANVDKPAEDKILSCLDALAGKVTILMVTHNLHVVEERVKKILVVQREVALLPVKEVCKHFALGLYHSLPSSR
ncbi:MAG: ATP-binding cassette domain-containing protein [Chlamydiia bacterium]|nr:ATP-binding cassette domain-containing protein [Chlamydiia bacterium]